MEGDCHLNSCRSENRSVWYVIRVSVGGGRKGVVACLLKRGILYVGLEPKTHFITNVSFWDYVFRLQPDANVLNKESETAD